MAGQASPKLSEIKAQLLATAQEKNRLDERYAPELFGRGSYAETQEKPVIAFLPVFSPIKQAQLGVRQRFKNGLDAQAQINTDQRSANSALSGQYRDVTTNIISLTVQMDLWKDLFGALSKAEYSRTELAVKKSKVEDEINKKALEISVRRLYWNLVANAEQAQIAGRLTKDAQDLLNDSRRRLAKSIGDAGDVARYEAQLAQRRSQTLLYTYQKDSLLKALKTLLPELNGKELDIAGYDIDGTIREVYACSQSITRAQTVPWEFTRYDEMMGLLKEQQALDRKMNESYYDVDLKLYGTVKSTGVGSEQQLPNGSRGSYGAAFDDMENNNRSGYEVGVTMAIPLGDARETTKNTQTIYNEERYKAQIDGFDAVIQSTHSELSKSLGLIGQVMETQKASTSALQRRMKVVRQKYAHARVSVNDLLLDQDALLNSELSTVDVQLQVLNVLFDYFMIFTDTPCSFNRIR